MLTLFTHTLSTHTLTHSHTHSVVTRALSYFLLLSSEMHRDAWTPVLLLCFTRQLQLNEHQVHTLTPSQPHTCTPSHLHTLAPSPHTCTYTLSHPHSLTTYMHIHTLAPSHHSLMLTPSHPHTLTPSQFRHQISACYRQLCDLVTMELKFEVRSILRRLFVRIGRDFQIVPATNTCLD